MKLLQLNVWGGRLEHLVGDLIEEQKPDIVCLQEAISFNGPGTGLFITIEKIKEQYDLPFLAFEPVISFRYMNGEARFGNCILSKYPIKETRTVFTHLEHKADFIWGEDNGNIRNFIHAVIEKDSIPFHVLTHHGYWIPDHKNGTEETIQQMNLIADYIGELEGPTILTGDFNLSPDSASLKRLNAELSNLCIKHKLTTTRTPLTRKTEVCDYIFVNNQIHVSTFCAEEKIASDHQALVMEFSV